MGIISKDMIEKWILPHLPVGTRGFETTVPLTEIIDCIFHRLNTGCQWRELPTKAFLRIKFFIGTVSIITLTSGVRPIVGRKSGFIF